MPEPTHRQPGDDHDAAVWRTLAENRIIREQPCTSFHPGRGCHCSYGQPVCCRCRGLLREPMGGD